MSSSSNDSHGVSQPSPILINITIEVIRSEDDNKDEMKSTWVKIATERKECEGVHFAATSKLSKIRIDVKTVVSRVLSVDVAASLVLSGWYFFFFNF